MPHPNYSYPPFLPLMLLLLPPVFDADIPALALDELG